MPDRGLLEATSLAPTAIAPTKPAPWAIPDARWAQLTYEVNQQAALATLPGDTGRPVPTYARLFVLEAGDSPVGPFKLASLMVGSRFKLLPRNVLVDAIVDGPVADIAAAFGSPFRAGSVSLERDGVRVVANVGDADGPLATLTLPELYAIDPGMLRWDPWLGYADQDGQVALVEYGPRPQPAEAWLTKGATLETGPGLARTHRWRTFRNLNTISACYVEGALELTAPEVQQTL